MEAIQCFRSLRLVQPCLQRVNIYILGADLEYIYITLYGWKYELQSVAQKQYSFCESIRFLLSTVYIITGKKWFKC